MLFFNNLEEWMVQTMRGLFPQQHFELQEGVKYLGFTLKPNHYGKKE
jgi:hypothetical protein